METWLPPSRRLTFPAEAYDASAGFTCWPMADCSMYARARQCQPTGVVVSLTLGDLGNVPLASWYACRASASCLRLLLHFIRAAASRTFCTAGSRRPIRIAIMAMTTSSSMSVNPARFCRMIGHPGMMRSGEFATRAQRMQGILSSQGISRTAVGHPHPEMRDNRPEETGENCCGSVKFDFDSGITDSTHP